MANLVIGLSAGFIFGTVFGAGVMAAMAAAARSEEKRGQNCAKSRGKM